MSSELIPARGGADRGEGGFTLVELLIVMALLAVVMSLAATGLFSINDATRSSEEKSFADTRLRETIEMMARDIRASNPIDVQTVPQPCTSPPCPQAPVSVYDRQISFEVFCTPVGGTCGSDNLRQIVYRVVSSRLELSEGGAFRTVLGPSATSSLPVAARQFAIVNTASEPVFTYLRDDGSVLATGGLSPAPAERFRDCTQAVRIHLRMITEPGNTRAPADLTTTVTLRNFNEVTGC